MKRIAILVFMSFCGFGCLLTSDKRPESAIHRAARTDDFKALMELTTSPKAANLKNEKGETPLMFAATARIARWLISRGAKVNEATTVEKWTPLHYAANSGLADVARVLIHAGAKVDAVESEGHTPLTLAVYHGEGFEVVRVLVQNKANVNHRAILSPIEQAAKNGDIKTLQLLVSNGARIDASNEWRITPLHLAAESHEGTAGNGTIQFFLRRGININARDSMGQTPLHFAARTGNVENVEYLLAHGANCRAKDKNNQSLLDYHRENAKGRAGFGPEAQATDKRIESLLSGCGFK